MGGEREEIFKKLAEVLKAGIRDEGVRGAILALFNIIEQDAETIRQLREEIQRLRDENNRLQGEQGKRSSGRKRGKKKDQIKIDRTQICEVDKDLLPPDAVFNGYAESTVQELAPHRTC